MTEDRYASRFVDLLWLSNTRKWMKKRTIRRPSSVIRLPHPRRRPRIPKSAGIGCSNDLGNSVGSSEKKEKRRRRNPA